MPINDIKNLLENPPFSSYFTHKKLPPENRNPFMNFLVFFHKQKAYVGDERVEFGYWYIIVIINLFKFILLESHDDIHSLTRIKNITKQQRGLRDEIYEGNNDADGKMCLKNAFKVKGDFLPGLMREFSWAFMEKVY